MKKCVFVILICLLLTACAQKSGLVTAEETGLDKDVTIDRDAMTITCGTDAYTYSMTGGTVRITYPNGWRYKNAEPSDAALAVGRIGGGVITLAGLILLFV